MVRRKKNFTNCPNPPKSRDKEPFNATVVSQFSANLESGNSKPSKICFHFKIKFREFFFSLVGISIDLASKCLTDFKIDISTSFSLSLSPSFYLSHFLTSSLSDFLLFSLSLYFLTKQPLLGLCISLSASFQMLVLEFKKKFCYSFPIVLFPT